MTIDDTISDAVEYGVQHVISKLDQFILGDSLEGFASRLLDSGEILSESSTLISIIYQRFPEIFTEKKIFMEQTS